MAGPHLLTLPPEIRSIILDHCFIGYELCYDHEGKRKINQIEWSENTFSVYKANRQLRDEAIPIMKAKTSIFDTTTSAWSMSSPNRVNGRSFPPSELQQDIPFTANIAKRIKVIMLNTNTKKITDLDLLPNLEVVALGSFWSRPVELSSNDDLSADDLHRRSYRNMMNQPPHTRLWTVPLLKDSKLRFNIWIKVCNHRMWWVDDVAQQTGPFFDVSTPFLSTRPTDVLHIDILGSLWDR